MRTWFSGILVLLLTTTMSFAQVNCDEEVLRALEIAAESCENTLRNEACYANSNLEASLNNPELSFDTRGDIVSLSQVDTISTSPYQSENQWGIALLRVQGDFPNTLPGQNITMLLMGGIELENAVPAQIEQTGYLNANARIRSTPDSSNNTNVLASLPAGTELRVNGRNEASDWVRVAYEGGGGWTAAFLVDDLELSELPVVNENETLMNPMQAIYVTAGIGQISCENAPNSLLISTPEDGGETTLTINGVQMRVGSTIQILMEENTETEANLTLRVFSGGVIMSSEGQVAFVPAGSQSTVLIDTSGDVPVPASAPSAVSPISVEDWNNLLSILRSESFNRLTAVPDTESRAVEIADEPLTVEEIPLVAEAEFYPNGAVTGLYNFVLASSNPLLGGNSGLLCSGQSFERFVDWDNLTYPYDGSSVPRIADNRYGASGEAHAAALNPSSTPDDAAFTNIAVSWTISSPTSFVYRVSSGQNRSLYGRQACDETWNANWIGS
jgi:hypothetical protein